MGGRRGLDGAVDYDHARLEGISDPCKDLLAKIFVKEPDRISIDDILRHAWVRDGVADDEDLNTYNDIYLGSNNPLVGRPSTIFHGPPPPHTYIHISISSLIYISSPLKTLSHL
jgi:hypothetical protein